MFIITEILAIKQIFPTMTKFIQSGFSSEILNTEIPTYVKYDIDGHREGSVMFTALYDTESVNF